jgi:hypothetical protein
MPIEADRSYAAVVMAAQLTESNAGTPGLWVRFALAEDQDHEEVVGTKAKTIWITQASRDMGEKQIKALGATEAQLKTRDFWADPGAVLVGARCSVTTEETEYHGKKRVEIKFINRLQKSASAAAIDRAMAMFGGNEERAAGFHVSDEDVPF